LNIRVGHTRTVSGNNTYTDGYTNGRGNMEVWATLVKPVGYSTDSCSETRYRLVTMAWDSTRFGTRTVGAGNDHWTSQPDGQFDPGMPFGWYTLCVRDTRQGYGATVTGTYNNTNPDGSAHLLINSSNLSSWATGTCNYTP
jgi:hypothetical protein